MSIELLTLRIVHVLGAITWGGSSIFNAFLIGPAMALAGPAAGPMLAALQKKNTFTIIPVVALVTMLAGLRLLMIDSAGFTAGYFALRSGQTFVAGGTCAVMAFLVFMLVAHPAMVRVVALGPQIAQMPEAERGALMGQMNALRMRMGIASKASALLLVAAGSAMAIGRYV
jgi:uncharacterized membrane protein